MKLSELRPCDKCGGALNGESHQQPNFYRVRVFTELLNPRAINQTLGLNQVFGGNALGLAEVFSPGTDKATETIENEDVLLCMRCASDLLALVEHRNNARGEID